MKKQIKLPNNGLYNDIRIKFNKFSYRGEQINQLSFHLMELHEFSPVYKKIIKKLLGKRKKKEFIETAWDLWSELNQKHEMEYHLFPAEKILGRILNKK